MTSSPAFWMSRIFKPYLFDREFSGPVTSAMHASSTDRCPIVAIWVAESMRWIRSRPIRSGPTLKRRSSDA
jgi:hypothetical protein